MSIISRLATASYSCGPACFVYDRVVSCCYNGDKFKGQEAELLIRDGVSAHNDTRFTSYLAIGCSSGPGPGQKKSAGIMETVCVTGEPGTGVNNLAVILSGRSA